MGAWAAARMREQPPGLPQSPHPAFWVNTRFSQSEGRSCVSPPCRDSERHSHVTSVLLVLYIMSTFLPYLITVLTLKAQIQSCCRELSSVISGWLVDIQVMLCTFKTPNVDRMVREYIQEAAMRSDDPHWVIWGAWLISTARASEIELVAAQQFLMRNYRWNGGNVSSSCNHNSPW